MPEPTPPSGGDARAAAAERLLRDRGVIGARVSVAGHEREIAAIAAPPSEMARLAVLAPELKALGFRYIALELTEPVDAGR
ncbi:MAG TPA: hypothetical protein VF188_08845 [Longimicrobiales bacterium]